MQAVVQSGYGLPGEVLSLGELPLPTPGPGEVRVQVRAASVHPDVWHVVRGWPLVLRLMGSGLTRPRQMVPGTDMAGVIEALGEGVTGLSVGDEVFGETIGDLQWMNGGAFAEYVCVAASSLAKKPAALSFEQAATLPTSGYIAVINLDWSERVEAGRRVLINGAGGCLGTLAIQLCKAAGAHVTAVDSARKGELLRSLGADVILDYEVTDFTRESERYDLIFDIASTLSLADCVGALTDDGRYVLIGHDHFGARTGRVLGSIATFVGLMLRSMFERGHLPPGEPAQHDKREVLSRLSALAEAGRLKVVIDRCFPLAEAAEALRYLAEGDPVGRVVITPTAA